MPRSATATRASQREPVRTRPRENRAHAEPTRERILNAASQLFAERGFGGTSMPAIAEGCDITAGAIYRHFTSKAELMLEVVKRALQALPFSLEGNHGDNDATRLPEVATRYIDPALKLLRRLSLEVHMAAGRDQALHTLLAEYNEAVEQRIREAIEAAQQAGTLDTTRDPVFTARAVMVFVMGLSHMDTLHSHLEGDRAWRESVAAYIAALIGLGAQDRTQT